MAENTTPLSGIHCVLHRMIAVDTDPTAATAVANLESIGDLGPEREMSEFHTHQDEWKRILPTTLSVPDIDFEAVMIGSDADQAAFEAQVGSAVESFFAISYAPKGDYATGHITRFKGFVKSFMRMPPKDDKVQVKFTLCVNGALTDEALA